MILSRVALGDPSVVGDLEFEHYLAYAAIAPTTRRVKRALEESIDDYARYGQLAFSRTLEQRERLRKKLGTLIQAPAQDIALTTGTTHGVLQLALCLDWRAGDRIVAIGVDLLEPDERQRLAVLGVRHRGRQHQRSHQKSCAYECAGMRRFVPPCRSLHGAVLILIAQDQS